MQKKPFKIELWLEQTNTNLNNILSFLARICFVVSFGALVVQVFLRNIPFLRSTFWAEEMARFLMIYMAMLTISIIACRDEHPKVDTILRMLPPKIANIWEYIRYILTIIFLSYLVYYGMRTVMRNLTTYTAGMKIAWGYVYFAVPLGSFLMAIQVLILVIKKIMLNYRGIIEDKYSKISLEKLVD